MLLATNYRTEPREAENLLQFFLRQADPRLAGVTAQIIEAGVRLNGTVDSYYLRTLAIAVSRRVAGTGEIQDQLQVNMAVAKHIPWRNSHPD